MSVCRNHYDPVHDCGDFTNHKVSIYFFLCNIFENFISNISGQTCMRSMDRWKVAVVGACPFYLSQAYMCGAFVLRVFAG